jgi:hypothetical protein
MNKQSFRIFFVCLSLFFFFISGCAFQNQTSQSSLLKTEDELSIKQIFSLPDELNNKILFLDPDSISENDIKDILSRCPAPRIFAFNGSIPLIRMDSFAKFLILMGYPEASIRNPRDSSYSYSSYTDSRKVAGMVAWYYEKSGMMPMLIGHSQGGMLAIKVLYELAGAFNEKIAVMNPFSEISSERYNIEDPLTGKERPVIGLKLGFVSAIATGTLMRFFLGQWDMLERLRKIPDTVEEFTGFHIKNDIISGHIFGSEEQNRYHPIASSKVRNVILPSEYSHITIVLTEDLAKDPEIIKWIDNYRPSGEYPEFNRELKGESKNILFAAEIWHSIKKYWCIELQRFILAHKRRNAPIE